MQDNNFLRLNMDGIERMDEPESVCHMFRQLTSRDENQLIIDRISHAESMLRRSDSSISSKRASKQRKATAKT